MIWRLVYLLLVACALTMPHWWSGFATGAASVVLAFDLATVSATRRHRRETAGRVMAKEVSYGGEDHGPR